MRASRHACPCPSHPSGAALLRLRPAEGTTEQDLFSRSFPWHIRFCYESEAGSGMSHLCFCQDLDLCRHLVTEAFAFVLRSLVVIVKCVASSFYSWLPSDSSPFYRLLLSSNLLCTVALRLFVSMFWHASLVPAFCVSHRRCLNPTSSAHEHCQHIF